MGKQRIRLESYQRGGHDCKVYVSSNHKVHQFLHSVICLIDKHYYIHSLPMVINALALYLSIHSLRETHWLPTYGVPTH
jgi:hypothetical protein